MSDPDLVVVSTVPDVVVTSDGSNVSDVVVVADGGGYPGSSISGAAPHGVLIATGLVNATSTAAMSDGQLLVGQSGADPLPKTLGGDATLAPTGVLTLNTVSVAKGGTGDTGTAWATYVPTVTAQTPGGTPPTFTVNTARYKQLGKTVFVEIDIFVTAAGTGAGQIVATLPVTAAAAGFYLTGLERGLTAKAVWAAINGGGSSSPTTMAIAYYDGTTAIATNSRPSVSGVYEAA